MGQTLKFRLLILLLFFAAGLNAQTKIEKINQVTDDLYSVFNEGKRPGCAIVVIRNGETIFQNCFGLSDLENDIPVTDSTKFFLASVSKQFTAYGIAKLLVNKELNYEETINQYLPDANSLWDSVKIKHLIHHTSGIWDWPYLFLATGHSFDDVLDSKNICHLIKSQEELSFTTGSKFQYTSSNYMLLGEIINQAVETGFYAWMKSNVIQPANMKNTAFQENHSDIINNRAKGYLYKNGRYYRTTNNLSPIGTGFMYSGIDDMANWLKFLLSNKDSKIANMMFQTGILDKGEEIPYAFGLMKKDNEVFWHDGYLQGFRAVTILHPNADFALALLSNSGSNYIVRSALTVADMYINDSIPREQIDNFKQKLIEEPQRKRKAAKELKYNQDLSELEGIYLNKELLITYKIFKLSGSLIAANAIEEILLKPIDRKADSFSSEKQLLGNFIFERGENGKVSGFRINQKRNNVIRFLKIE